MINLNFFLFLGGKVHHVQIQQTGPAHLNVTSNQEQKDEEMKDDQK